ncbi:MAG: sel1 repeat family protein [Sedimentisphaerales bacterium]|nr:sel1 repeat family protein [Sedimentisphaerales bacterium]
MKKLVMVRMMIVFLFLSSIAYGRYWPGHYDSGRGLALDEKTYNAYLSSAESGDKDAQYIIGGLYLKGLGVSQDISKSIGWLTMAAQANQLDAQQLLAKLYFLGERVERNDALAYKWLAIMGARNLWLRSLMNDCKVQIDKAAVEQGQKLAQIWLEQWKDKCMTDPKCTFEAFEKTIGISCFYPGNGTGVRKELARNKDKLFQLGNGNGHGYGDTRREFGQTAKNTAAMSVSSDIKEQVDALLALARSGDVRSQTRAGVCFFYGTGYREDNLKALYWFTIAADNGDADAIFCLGRMHMLGIGTVQNPGRAVELLTKAAAKKQVDAMYLLAREYYYGDILEKDDAKAYKWISLMAASDKKAEAIKSKCESIMSREDIEQGRQMAQKPVKVDRVKVGVFVSLYSAKGPSWWQGSEIGWNHVGIASRFNDIEEYELYALIDPGTADDPSLKGQLANYKFSSMLLDASKVEDLQKVDIMVSGNWHVNIKWEIIDAVIEAVKSGVHLVNFEHFGLVRPAYATGFQATKATWASHMNNDIKNNPAEIERYKQKMTELFGLKDPRFIWHLGLKDWKINSNYPGLDFIAAGTITKTCGINGLVGDYVEGQAFELVDDQLTDQWDGRSVARKELNPFTVYRCGKGLAVNMGIVGEFKNIGFPDRDDFVKYCVDWVVEHGGLDRTVASEPVKVRESVWTINQKLISRGLSVSGDYSTAEILNDFGWPYRTEKIAGLEIWYYKITNDYQVPFFIVDDKLIAYGEVFFQTMQWRKIVNQ